jgi:hypothetical protein
MGSCKCNGLEDSRFINFYLQLILLLVELEDSYRRGRAGA